MKIHKSLETYGRKVFVQYTLDIKEFLMFIT